MSDFKSKLPDIQELTSMTTKLFNGIKNSVTEIVNDYKQKRATAESSTDENKSSETNQTTDSSKVDESVKKNNR